MEKKGPFPSTGRGLLLLITWRRNGIVGTTDGHNRMKRRGSPGGRWVLIQCRPRPPPASHHQKFFHVRIIDATLSLSKLPTLAMPRVCGQFRILANML